MPSSSRSARTTSTKPSGKDRLPPPRRYRTPPQAVRWLLLTPPTAPPAATTDSRGDGDGSELTRNLLGRSHCRLNSHLRRPRRFRYRRRHSLRYDARRAQARPDDDDHRAVLGWQRDLVGGDRRQPLRRVPGGLRGVSRRLLSAGDVDALRLDIPRPRVRVPLSQYEPALV